MTQKPKILFIAPCINDAAVHRRAHALQQAGADVRTFAFERGASRMEAEVPDIQTLGMLTSGFCGRLISLIRAFRVLKGYVNKADQVDIIYCRNLDLALLGILVSKFASQRSVLVYEVLDIHPRLSESGIVGLIARMFERIVLSKANLLVVSSSGFISGYFREIQNFKNPWFLLENKLPQVLSAPAYVGSTKHITIGYFGNFRCAESFRVLQIVATEMSEKIKVVLAGQPNKALAKAFHEFAKLPNVSYLGQYKYPKDIAQIYKNIDLNWVMDLDGDFNANLLLPNRVYEGGAMAVPALAEKGTQTGDFVDGNDIGFTLERPIAPNLIRLLNSLTDRTLEEMRAQLVGKDRALFYEINEHHMLLEKINTLR